MPHRSLEAGRNACRSHYQRNKSYYTERNATRRAALRVWLDELKSQPCVGCGNSYPPKAMDWHHRDPSTKEFDLGMAASRMLGRNRILSEIAKCDLMCAVCHRLMD